LTGDLLVIVPTRGRPQNLARLLGAVHATRTAVTHVAVAVDDDDPDLAAYEIVMAEHGGAGDWLTHGPRDGLIGWTNAVALPQASEYRYLASFGDDHLPRTKGWDTALLRAIDDMGGTGISFPWDGMREDVPEAPVVSSDIVQALGWLLNPACQHYYGDDTLGALGRGAGCLRHCRAVWVEHVHPGAGTAPGDRTYKDSSASIAADKAAYQTWRQHHMATDVATIRALREQALQPA
jgi:hypothetical protein